MGGVIVLIMFLWMKNRCLMLLYNYMYDVLKFLKLYIKHFFRSNWWFFGCFWIYFFDYMFWIYEYFVYKIYKLKFKWIYNFVDRYEGWRDTIFFGEKSNERFFSEIHLLAVAWTTYTSNKKLNNIQPSKVM